MNLWHLIQGDARYLPLADGSVQCCTTSPPYWSLRDYGIAPSVWGGDDSCSHEWEDQTKKSGGAYKEGSKKRWQHGADDFGRDDRFLDGHPEIPAGSLCSKCGAWFGCLGLEPTPELFVAHMVIVFREVRRVLRDDGTLFLNIGDTYASGGRGGNPTADSSTLQGGQKNQQAGMACRVKRGSQLPAGFHEDARQAGQVGRAWVAPPPGMKNKDRVGIPHMLAFALRADGWYWRDEIIWHKPNPMPESVTDRTTKAHEFIFVFSKSPRYFYDADAIREPVTSTGGASVGKQNHSADGTMAQSRKFADPADRNHPLGRNMRSVWSIATQSCPEAHFATFPVRLPRRCIKAGTSEKGCCRKCGACWKRVVERVPTGQMQKMADGWDTGEGGHGSIHRAGREKGATNVPVMAKVTTHWLPSCKCAAGDPVPCIVLDNFSGAGTTGIAAAQLGRRYIGNEFKREYIDIAARRIPVALAKKTKHKKARRVLGEQTLFGREIA